MKLLYWFVLSSKDSSKWSATIKNALPLVIALGTLFKLDLSWLPQGVDFIVQTAAQVTALITTITTAWAFFRKVRLTQLGQNAVLNDSSLR